MRRAGQKTVLAIALGLLLGIGQTFAATTFSPGVQVGTVANSAITEASGIVASRANANVFWTHNDSGDTARVFAMTQSGTHLGTFALSGASATDWEDIAIGPGPQTGSQYLYVGDIGDNSALRTSISVYRVAEPAVAAGQPPVTTSLANVDRLRFTYPDGPRDAESLFVDPLTSDIYILTKRENPHRLYRAAYPQSTTATTPLEFVASYADPNWLTAADISADGDEIIARATGVNSGRLFVRPPGGTIADALSSTPITIPLVALAQGEAIAFDPQGWGYYTISEGAGSPIHYFNRVADAGDENRDGVVDAADYVHWRWAAGAAGGYNAWRTNFGRSSSAGNSPPLAVPEPAALCLGCWLIALARFKRAR